jgi:hypothetical protein
MMKEDMMAKKEPTEYRAKLTDDAGVIRGKIPSPLVKELGGRPGDYMVFRSDGSGKVSVSLSRSRGGTKKSAKGKKVSRFRATNALAA